VDYTTLSGSLNSIIEFLHQLKERYGKDYLELSVAPNPELPGIELTGVRNYSDETLAKMQQLRALMLQLPEEAAHEVLRNCAEEEEEVADHPTK
jgi:hypothetical protein